MAFPLASLFQVSGWPMGTYSDVLIALGIVALVLVLVYVALYSTEES
jgi:hypothetical protein